MDLRDELEATAYWRESVAVKYPNDTRNSDAAVLLRKLAEQPLSDDINNKLQDAWNQYEDVCLAAPEDFTFDSSITADHLKSETFRSIGFGYHPDTIDEVAIEVIGDIEIGTSDIRDALAA
jgi:hypothetical protein